jgi:hypothetical protein
MFMKAYCPRCEEIRTDTGEDAWGFVWYSGAPICQRCQSVVEFVPNGQREDNEIEAIEEDEDNGDE